MSKLDLERDTEELLGFALGECFPTKGKILFVPSASGAHVDPLGSTPHLSQRSADGRWGLYTDGILEAGDRLVDSLGPDEMATVPGAALLYPIVFLYRHYLEMELKSFFGDMNNPTALPATSKKGVEKTHGLKKLWEAVVKEHPQCDAWA